jgi:hypothetical protein
MADTPRRGIRGRDVVKMLTFENPNGDQFQAPAEAEEYWLGRGMKLIEDETEAPPKPKATTTKKAKE